MGIDIPVGINHAAFKSGLDQMRGQATGFAHSLTGLFAGISLASMFDKALDKAKDIHEVSQKFGDTAENIQKLGAAVKKVGGDMETAAKGGFKAFLEAQKAVSGDASAQKKFDALGISLEKLAALKGPRDTLLALADAVHGAANEHVALAAAGELVGGRQASLIQLFRMGGDAMRKAGEDAAIMSNDTVERLAKAQKSIEKMKNQLTIWVGEVGGFFLRLVQTVGAASTFIGERLAAALDGDFSNDAADRYAKKMKGIWEGDNEKDAEGPKGDIIDGEASKQADQDAKDAEKAATERQKLLDDIAKLEEKHRLEAMDAETRLQALMEKRKALQDSIGYHFVDGFVLESEPKTAEQLEAKKEMLELDEKIGKQKADNDKAAEAIQQKIDDQKQKAAEQLQSARDKEAAALEKNKIAAMAPDEKRDYFKQKQDMLFYEANKAEEGSDPTKAANLRAEAAGLQSEIENPNNPDKEQQNGRNASFKVSSLTSVGGGGGIAQGDPSLRALEKSNSIAEESRELLRELVAHNSGGGGNSSHHFPNPK